MSTNLDAATLVGFLTFASFSSRTTHTTAFTAAFPFCKLLGTGIIAEIRKTKRLR